MLPEAGEELAQVYGVLLRVAAGDVHVVHVGEDRLQVRHRPVHLPLDVAPAFMSPNGIRRYSKDPNGVVIAVF